MTIAVNEGEEEAREPMHQPKKNPPRQEQDAKCVNEPRRKDSGASVINLEGRTDAIGAAECHEQGATDFPGSRTLSG